MQCNDYCRHVLICFFIFQGKSTDIKAVEANKPYLFHAIRKNPDTWHFQSASHSGYYICADGEKIVIARHENDNKYFKIVFNKKCKEMLITHKDTMLHFVWQSYYALLCDRCTFFYCLAVFGLHQFFTFIL